MPPTIMRLTRTVLYLLPPVGLLLFILTVVWVVAHKRIPLMVTVTADDQRWLADYFLRAVFDKPVAPQAEPPSSLADVDLLLATLYAPPEEPRYYHQDAPFRDHHLAQLAARIRLDRETAASQTTTRRRYLKLELKTSRFIPLAPTPAWLTQYLVDDAAEGFKIETASGPPRFVFPTAMLEGKFPGYGKLFAPRRGKTAVYRFRTHAFLLDPEGNRDVRVFRNQPEREGLTAARVRQAIQDGADFLVRHQKPSGKFDYWYDPIGDRYLWGYNLLRHAGVCFSLYQVYGLTKHTTYLKAADKAIAWLIKHHVRTQEDLSFVLSGRKAKLGGGALILLALTERQRWVRDGRDLDLMRQLGRFIAASQRPNGDFQHYFRWSEQAAVPKRGSIYYPGEATLALVRLYGVTGEPQWLRLAMKGADFLIRRWRLFGLDIHVPPDHWLMYALSELYEETGERRFLDYCRKIGDTIVAFQFQPGENRSADFQGGTWKPVFPRSTPTAARAEGLGALCSALRVGGHAEDASRCAERLLAAAAFQLTQQLTPRNHFYTKNPERALGGFFGSIVQPTVRIDYVQHNISALLQALLWLE